MKRWLLLILICINTWQLSTVDVMAGGTGDELVEKLTSALYEFAEVNGIDEAQLERLLWKVVLEGEKGKKGGIGVIDDKTFVYLNSPVNELKVSGETWKGKSSQRGEVVIVDGDHARSCGETSSLSSPRIIIFKGKEVQYINLENRTGGIYLRK